MASKQNIFYVPWPDVSEWNTVRDQIFSSNINDTILAYETISMWKLRFDSLPAYVECTYSLLQVMIKEYRMIRSGNPDLFDERDLQLSYSTALIRFVNHVLSVSSYRGETIFFAARSQNIPDWVINLRHEVSHGQDLPMLNVLHDAVQLSLEWLLDVYWLNYDCFMEKDLNDPHTKFPVGSRDNVQAKDFLKKALELWDLCCDVKDSSNISQEFFFLLDEILNVNNLCLKSKHLTYLQDIVQSYYEAQKKKKKGLEFTLDVNEFKASFLGFLKRIAKRNEHVMDCLVISLIESSFMSVKHTNPEKWKPILNWIHRVEMLPSLLEILLQMAGRQHQGAIKWLTVLSPSLKVIRKRCAMLKLLRKGKKDYDNNKLKKAVLKSYKSKKSLFFEAFICPVLSLNMLKGLLMNPEYLDSKVMIEYLKLVKPPVPNSTIKLMVNLMNLYTSGNGMKSSNNMDVDNDIFTLYSFQSKNDEAYKETSTGTDGWVKSSIDTQGWNECPLGLLPFQTKVDCNLPKELTWKRKLPSQNSPVLLEKHSAEMKRFQKNIESDGFVYESLNNCH